MKIMYNKYHYTKQTYREQVKGERKKEAEKMSQYVKKGKTTKRAANPHKLRRYYISSLQVQVLQMDDLDAIY